MSMERSLAARSIPVNWRNDTGQVLEHYISYSLRNDVEFYFANKKMDWRVEYLVPMCRRSDNIGTTLTDLLVALQRLRLDGSSSLLARMYHTEAVQSFHALLGSAEATKLLACAMMFMQYDMNANLSQTAHTHLSASAAFIELIEKERSASSLPFGAHSSTISASRMNEDEWLLQHLKLTHHIYDLASALMTGSPLYCNISIYRNESSFSIHNYPSPPVLAHMSVDSLWRLVHLLWAEMMPLTHAPSPTGFDTAITAFIEHSLFALDELYNQDINFAPRRVPYQVESPFGNAQVYKSPAHRHLHQMINHLILIFTSFVTTPSSLPTNKINSTSRRIVFDRYKCRNAIFRANAMLINSADVSTNERRNETYLHQCFPAILPLMVAASEVPETDVVGQQWINRFVHRFEVHGLALGLVLTDVLRMLRPVAESPGSSSSPSDAGDGRSTRGGSSASGSRSSRTTSSHAATGWEYVGARDFILGCRQARQSGLA